MEPARDSHGRFKADHHIRNRTIGAALIGTAALAIGTLFRGRIKEALSPANAEHEASDLSFDAARPGTNRAPDAFRPDPSAPVPASEREGLRPPTGFPTTVN
ncbi:hypothetical protein M0208_07345 [Sphingomonas sp. SUN019]|uniref:hypothetical protein n=1 Tax=Sphingomonas sp. SUN019 TaxID=2937788 RepID=UPI0021649040|nr:hypothetical protein [Sphingomonas sp. SUN019]UVO50343.1 hypothetical protein M0208_07345 [Sphingomonas sp. SUN019]